MKTIICAIALLFSAVGWSQGQSAYQQAQIQAQLNYQNRILTEMNDRQRREDMAIQNREFAEWKRGKNQATQSADQDRMKKAMTVLITLSFVNPRSDRDWRAKVIALHDQYPSAFEEPEVRQAVAYLSLVDAEVMAKTKSPAELDR